jgi:hypothetical protein
MSVFLKMLCRLNPLEQITNSFKPTVVTPVYSPPIRQPFEGAVHSTSLAQIAFGLTRPIVAALG